MIGSSGELITVQVKWQTVLWGIGLQFIFAILEFRAWNGEYSHSSFVKMLPY